MEIDPRHLRHILAISRTGSLTQAARELNISQPALSISMSRLEDVLGVRLLERGRHGSSLNAAGRILVRHAGSVETIIQSALSELKLGEHSVAGPIAVGGTPLATASIIPDIVGRLHRESGPLACRIVEGVDEALLDRLHRYELDVIVCTVGLDPLEEDVEETPLFQARLSAVATPGHWLAERRSVSLSELKDEQWVLPPHGGAFVGLVEAMFTTCGIRFPVNIVHAAQFAIIKEIILRTDAVTLLSDQIVARELADGTLVAVPLEEEAAVRSFGLKRLKSRELSRLGERFCEIALDIGKTYNLDR